MSKGLTSLSIAVLALLITGCASHSNAELKTDAVASAAPEQGIMNPAPDLEVNPPSTVGEVDTELPTIFIAGDSTAAHSSSTIQQGWATPFAQYFDPTKVNIINRARGGRSSRTFVTEGLWDELVAAVKTNDIVLIQFGHNDGGLINDERRARGSLRGLGEETEEIDNLMTGQHEVVHTYGWYLRKMISDVQSKGATPILLSLTIRNIWKDGHVERGSGRYGEWAEETGRTEGVQFIDLTQMVADEFDSMGQAKVTTLYEKDHTHFNPEGANLHARFVVLGLKELPNHPVDQYLSAAGKAVGQKQAGANGQARNIPRVGPVHKGFNPALPTVWLIGDSTVKNSWDRGDDGLWGWGNPIAAFFDPSRINVENQALGGTSGRSYLNTGLWEAVREQIKPGDFVIMQFGHNDGGGTYDDDRARKSIKGSGDESLEITLQKTGEKETVHTYGWYLGRYIKDTKAAGATPIVCSLIPRNDWADGKIQRADDSYGKWAREAAEQYRAQFIDLNTIVADRYDKMGEAAVKPYFPKEHTHTGWDGAVLNAECVMIGIRSLDDCPLKGYLQSNPERPKEP